MTSPLSAGSSDTVTLSAGEGITLDTDPGVVAVIEAASGVAGFANRAILARHTGGRAFYGPFTPGGTVRVSAVGGSAAYVVGRARSGNGSTGGDVENETIFYPPTDDYAGIMAARAAAIAAGGGVVQLKAITYDLTAAPAAIPLTAGVEFRGAGYTYSTGRFLSGGTILQGGTTHNVFEHNPVDSGVQIASSALMYSGSIYSAGVSNLAIEGGLNCIRVGGLYSAGAFYCEFDNLHLENPVEWCGFFENVSLSAFRRINTNCSTSGIGHWWNAGSHGAIYNHGNNEYTDCFAEGGSALTRNVVFMARGGAGNFNDLSAFNIQCNAQGVTLSAAATMANGSPNITVPDATNYPIDMPVTVSVAVNGFTLNQTYFVVSSSGTTIQVADHMGGTARNATGNTAVNIVRHGYPCIEVIGYGLSNVNSIQPSSFLAMDAEGVATTCMAVQNAQIVLGFNFVFGQTSGVASSLACRNVFGSFSSSSGLTTDFDSNSANRFISNGAAIRAGTPINNAANGYISDVDANLSGLMMGSFSDSVRLSLRGINSSGRAFLYPQHSMGQRQWFRSDAATLSMFGPHHGTGTYTGTANTIWNLPTLTGTASPTANSYLGSVWNLVNASTTGGVTLTINTQAGQGLNRSADTQIVLAVGQSVCLHACTDGTGQFWAVLSASPGVTL